MGVFGWGRSSAWSGPRHRGGGGVPGPFGGEGAADGKGETSQIEGFRARFEFFLPFNINISNILQRNLGQFQRFDDRTIT